MSNPSTKPTYVSLHRLGQLSGKARGTLLLRMRDGELVPDALLDLGGKPHPSAHTHVHRAHLRSLGRSVVEPGKGHIGDPMKLHSFQTPLTLAFPPPLTQEEWAMIHPDSVFGDTRLTDFSTRGIKELEASNRLLTYNAIFTSPIAMDRASTADLVSTPGIQQGRGLRVPDPSSAAELVSLVANGVLLTQRKDRFFPGDIERFEFASAVAMLARIAQAKLSLQNDTKINEMLCVVHTLMAIYSMQILETHFGIASGSGRDSNGKS